MTRAVSQIEVLDFGEIQALVFDDVGAAPILVPPISHKLFVTAI
jgi:hypothetical protein